MKEVYIAHNPYTLETVVTINGKAPASNSSIPQLTESGRRLQDWVDELPGTILKSPAKKSPSSKSCSKP